MQRNPVIAHLLRAAERFNDRLGNQFGAAITYFSFLSMIPILMVSFAAAGFVLAWHPTLLQGHFRQNSAKRRSDPTLAATLKNTINTAVQQRTAVGLVGLLVALYSGINWMGNLREAIRAQSRDVWERRPQDEGENLGKVLPRSYLADRSAGGADYYAVDHLRRRLRPADDYLRAVSRQH